MSEERRVSTALAFLLGWYVVLGAAAIGTLAATRPAPELAWLVGPVAAVAAVVVAPVTLAVLAQSRRRLSPFALATISMAVGLTFVVAASLVALALR